MEIIQVAHRYAVLDDEPSAAAAVLARLKESGVGLVGFSEFPHSPGKSQLDLIAADGQTPAHATTAVGLTLSRLTTGFLIRGDDSPGAAVADILKRLAEANIEVISVQAVAAGAGRFGALLWVKPNDVEATAKVLGASVWLHDLVDEASEESFPASDAPAWAMERLA